MFPQYNFKLVDSNAIVCWGGGGGGLRMLKNSHSPLRETLIAFRAMHRFSEQQFLNKCAIKSFNNILIWNRIHTGYSGYRPIDRSPIYQSSHRHNDLAKTWQTASCIVPVRKTEVIRMCIYSGVTITLTLTLTLILTYGLLALRSTARHLGLYTSWAIGPSVYMEVPIHIEISANWPPWKQTAH